MKKNKNDNRKQSLRNLEKIMLQIMVIFKCVHCFETRQNRFERGLPVIAASFRPICFEHTAQATTMYVESFPSLQYKLADASCVNNSIISSEI